MVGGNTSHDLSVMPSHAGSTGAETAPQGNHSDQSAPVTGFPGTSERRLSDGISQALQVSVR
jgi:hypothetical protein